MWALTSAQAEDTAEQLENEEADELLNFALGLDFDKYINDSEVSALIENVRSRLRVSLWCVTVVCHCGVPLWWFCGYCGVTAVCYCCVSLWCHCGVTVVPL
jgi:hypothetical protein